MGTTAKSHCLEKKTDTRRTYNNYIGGRWVKSESGETFASVNPANVKEVIGHFAASTPGDVRNAVDAAAAALPQWRHTPAPHRAKILLRAAYLLETRKEELARLMVREMGKVMKEVNVKIAGLADAKLVSDLVRERLTKV